MNVIDNYDASKNDAVDYAGGIHPNIAGSGILTAKVLQLITAPIPVFTRSVDTLIAPLGYGYQWYLNGDTVPAVSGGLNKKLTIHSSGNYSVGVKLNNNNLDRLMSASVSETPGALPVSFLYFNVYKNNFNAILSRETTSEIRNKEFEVQKSIDGKVFYTLGYIPASENDLRGATYSYTDTTFHNEDTAVYYLLKQIDEDANFTYSNIVFLPSEEIAFSPVFYPNPLMIPSSLSVSYYSVNEV